MQDPKQRLTLRQVMRHPWVTRRNAWPLKTVREMLLHGEDPSAPPVLPDLMSTYNVLDIPRQVLFCHPITAETFTRIEA